MKVAKDKRAESLYDARVFEGEQAVANGLVDEVGNISSVLAATYPDCKQKLMEESPIIKRLKELNAWI